jgi:hypothetical protein
MLITIAAPRPPTHLNAPAPWRRKGTSVGGGRAAPPDALPKISLLEMLQNPALARAHLVLSEAANNDSTILTAPPMTGEVSPPPLRLSTKAEAVQAEHRRRRPPAPSPDHSSLAQEGQPWGLGGLLPRARAPRCPSWRCCKILLPFPCTPLNASKPPNDPSQPHL